MTIMTRHFSTFTIAREQLVTTSCLAALVLASCGYMYFVSVSIVHVVLQQEAKQELGMLRSEISALEREYIAAQHAVSERIAGEPGLVAVGEKVFLRRGADSLVLAPAGE